MGAGERTDGDMGLKNERRQFTGEILTLSGESDGNAGGMADVLCRREMGLNF